MELIEMVAGKLHGVKITESALDYHGSITIDQSFLKASGILPLEFVYIWNKNSGSRISTYVIPGPEGSGVICLNGAAARSCQVGDEVIISAARKVEPGAVYELKPRVVTFRHDVKVNEIDEIFAYDLKKDGDGWTFETVKIK